MSKRQVLRREDVGDETPLRLDVAARLVFPDGSIGLSGLRREAAKGRLKVWRIAGKDMTTLSEIRKMVEQCLVSPSPPDCGSDQPPTTEMPSGSLSTGGNKIALAAAKMRVRRLKESSASTSRPSTTQHPSEHGMPPKFR